MRRPQGFTLIELMIVIAIVAILAAIAIPAYTDYILRSRITEAVSTLSAMRAKMEQFFQDNRTYAGAGGTGTPATVANCPSGTANFSYNCGTPDAAGYTITANGSGAMRGFTYTVNQAGTKTSAGPTGWTASTSCWILKRDGSCA